MINANSDLTRRFITEGALPDCPIIDFHAHMRTSSVGYLPAAEPERMLAAMDDCHVALALFSSHWALESPYHTDDDLEVVRNHPDRFRCYRVARPQNESVKHDLEMMELYADFHIGIKFHPDWHKTPMSDKAYAPYWAYADAHKLLCLSHTWGGSAYDGPNEAQKILERYPNLTFIAGHSFHGEWERACELAQAYPNLYLELTAVMDDRGALELFCERVGSERILFGCDMPWFSYWYYIGAICSADIDDRDRRNILYRNGMKLLSRYDWFIPFITLTSPV